VDTLNVWHEHLPEFDYEAIGAKYKAVKHETMTEAESKVWQRIQSLIQRFQSADRIVLGTPMWNFGLLYKLKQLIDLVAQRNYLFTYYGKQYGPFLNVEKAVAVYKRGSRYLEGTPISCEVGSPERRVSALVLSGCAIYEIGVRITAVSRPSRASLIFAFQLQPNSFEIGHVRASRCFERPRAVTHNSSNHLFNIRFQYSFPGSRKCSMHTAASARRDLGWPGRDVRDLMSWALKKAITLVDYARMLRIAFLVWSGFCALAVQAYSQEQQEEPVPGPDSHETGQGPHGHLFGDWGGERTRLLERGIDFDFQYVSDSLWNIKSTQKERFASWNRFRGTVDIDFGKLVGEHDLYFHATALWQGGGNLGTYLGLLTSPSGMSSMNTCRLDSWWIEKRWLDERIVARLGQFAGQDFYGAQHYAASFIFEPMGYALGNLFTTVEVFDPPSTPAMEVRVIPLSHFYVKSMVLAGDRFPFSHNPTGLVPQFRGAPVSVSEIGFTPGRKASSIRAFDNVDARKGYSGLYQFGASYNPGKFTTASAMRQSGNYLLYWMASQALWRVDRKEAKGLDGTIAYDRSPADVNRNNTMLTAGLRFNEPLPLPIHNTMSLGYVQNRLSQQFVPEGAPRFKPEHGVEFNTLLDPLPMLLLQPVIQYYENVGAKTGRAVVFGFRTKVEF
jgi:carbohydrate-selective porin OprB